MYNISYYNKLRVNKKFLYLSYGDGMLWLRPGWLREKSRVFSIYFQFFVGSTTKKLVCLCFCIQYSFSVFKKSGFEYRKWKQLFSVFIFYEYEYSGIFVNIVKTKNYFFWVMWYVWVKKIFFRKKRKKENNNQTQV